jgi:vacuolar-type H+-ATPase subunit H
MATEVHEGNGDGSLAVLRLLKEAEESGETKLAQTKATASREIEQARTEAQQALTAARQQAQAAKQAKVTAGLQKAKAEADAILAAARKEAEKVTPFNLLDIELLFPEILEALFGEFGLNREQLTNSK